MASEYIESVKIKQEVDRTSLQTSELNIKTECEAEESENPLQPLYVEKQENPGDPVVTVGEKVNSLFQHKYFKRENRDEDLDEDILSDASDVQVLRKACIIQTCLSLLDSSSSDEDELLLLWLLQGNRKRKLTKRKKL